MEVSCSACHFPTSHARVPPSLVFHLAPSSLLPLEFQPAMPHGALEPLPMGLAFCLQHVHKLCLLSPFQCRSQKDTHPIVSFLHWKHYTGFLLFLE